MVDRGLAPTRERARALILAGQVRVDGAIAPKAGTPVDDRSSVELVVPDHPWVSRGGVKLAHALDAFGIRVAGRRALDVGASTGGFTHVLLDRGAVSVVAVDVGRGQLDWRLRNDPRVIVREGVNARALSADDVPEKVDIVTIDVSFISLRLILPALRPLLAAGKHGLVTDPLVHEAVIARVTASAEASGLRRVGMTPSPITGAAGNREFFLHLRPRP
jgi:23S rRNA (cytidine1920-2'-O)/16S rRNA (cytidine1409-2'-O)-methyltransferase